MVPTIFSKFHAAFTQGSEPDSLLLAWHSGLDVFSLTTAANCPESHRLHGIALELSRSSRQLKEQGPCVVTELRIGLKSTVGLGTGQCGRILVVATSLPSFRLPILQGGTFAFVAPSLAMLSLPAWKCPEWTLNASQVNTSSPEFTEEWQKRIREVTGELTVELKHLLSI